REGGLPHGAHHAQRGQREGAGRGDPRPGRLEQHRRARPRVRGVDQEGLRDDPRQLGRSRGAGLQRGLPRGPRPAARQGAARARAQRDLRRRAAHLLPRPLPGGQGGAARDAPARLRLVPDLQQRLVAAGTEAPDRAVPLLPAGADAHARPGAHRGVLGARRARRQRHHRRPHRLAGHPRAAARPAAARDRDEPGQDRGGLLVPAHPGPLLLDARPAAHAVLHEAELLIAPASAGMRYSRGAMRDRGRGQGLFYGWWVVGAFSVTTFMSTGVRHAVGPFLKPIVADLDLDRASFSAVIALSLFLYGVFMTLAGMALDRFSVRIVTSAGTLLLAASLVLTAMVQNVWQFAAVYGVLVPLGLAGTGPVIASGVVARWFSRRRGTALSVLGSASMTGMSLLVPAVTWL